MDQADQMPDREVPVTAPDRAAVEIARVAIGYGRHEYATIVVAALDAAKLLRQPDEAAYVAALADEVDQLRAEAENDARRIEAAEQVNRLLMQRLGAAPTAETGGGEAWREAGAWEQRTLADVKPASLAPTDPEDVIEDPRR